MGSRHNLVVRIIVDGQRKSLSYQEVLPEELLKKRPIQSVPGDGVGDGREDPVQFSQHRSAIAELA